MSGPAYSLDVDLLQIGGGLPPVLPLGAGGYLSARVGATDPLGGDPDLSALPVSLAMTLGCPPEEADWLPAAWTRRAGAARGLYAGLWIGTGGALPPAAFSSVFIRAGASVGRAPGYLLAPGALFSGDALARLARLEYEFAAQNSALAALIMEVDGLRTDVRAIGGAGDMADADAAPGLGNEPEPLGNET